MFQWNFAVDAVFNDLGTEPGGKPASLLDPDAIAESYLALINQDRSAWTGGPELRPRVGRFQGRDWTEPAVPVP